VADDEAKKAGKGLVSDKFSLPPYLRRDLLINPSAEKQHQAANLKEKWTNTWRNSIRGSSVFKLDSTTPLKGFLRRISDPVLSRKASSPISQLVIAPIPFNTYLEGFKRADSARRPPAVQK